MMLLSLFLSLLLMMFKSINTDIFLPLKPTRKVLEQIYRLFLITQI